MRSQCFAFCTASGKLLTQVEPHRIHEAVMATAISTDCRHLWAALGEGFICRFECLGAEEVRESWLVPWFEGARCKSIPGYESARGICSVVHIDARCDLYTGLPFH